MYCRLFLKFNRANIYTILTSLTLILPILTSCTGVRITDIPVPPEIHKLKSTNTKSVRLTTAGNDKSEIIGHQYLLIVIPFGRIVSANPEISLYNKAFTKLALKGYNIDKSENAKKNKVQLTLSKLQLSAYDLFFIRNLYCKMEIKLELLDPYNRVKYSESFKAEKSGYKTLAFSNELQHIFEQCLEEAVNHALNNI